ncbi:hypothetical protein JW998_03340 [candidate division KSB1 bacterium]|nr:hypothetical protein [candidate division KSB1 bacterium]
MAAIVKENSSFLHNARPVLPDITIIYSYRTMMQQARTRRDYSGVGRDANALESIEAGLLTLKPQETVVVQWTSSE